MAHPASIPELIAAYGLTDITQIPAQQRIIHWQAYLAAFEADPDANPGVQPDAGQLRAAALARMRMSECANTYLLDDAGQLIALNLYGKQLPEFAFDPHIDWQHLQVLVLSGNRLTALRLPAGLTQLRFLDAGDNPELRHLVFETALPHFETLDASDSGLERIAVPAGMTGLKTLDLSRNHLTEAVFEGDCAGLEWLDLSGNGLVEFRLPTGFQNLQYLYLTQNSGLRKIAFGSPLRKLDTLHLRGCALEALPPDLLEFKALQSLYLHGNPLPTMQDVISGGENDNSWKAVYHYLNSQRRGHALVPLREAKLILVGNGEVGKTSISIKLRDRNAPLPEKHERTPALAIEPYVLEKLSPEITGQADAIDRFQLNIWDFGGQGKYREIQQLFCSRKSLYLFVTACDDLPTNEDYVGFDYWLSMVSGFSFDETTQHSPVIYVVNKIDKEAKDVEEGSVKAAFPNIKSVVKISCLKLKNLDQLEDDIRERLRDVSPDIFTARFPENWLAVKQALEARKAENVMPLAEYLRICREDHQMADEDEALNWLEILDRIGVVIYLGKNPRLADKIILNPEWVKDAIVQVIDSGEDDDGIIRKKDFRKIWEKYPSGMDEDFIELLLAYQLCFERTDDRGRPEYVVPALLPAGAPQLPPYLTGTPVHRFRFSFKPFFPAGTVNKLMVQIKNRVMTRPDILLEESGPAGFTKSQPLVEIEILNDYFWNKNLILRDHRNNAYAHVWEDWNERCVYLNFFGEATEHQSFLRFLENAVRQLNSELKTARKIYHLDFATEVFRNNKWKNLNDLEEEGIHVFDHPTRKTMQQTSKLKCFVSYAHADDSRYMRCFIEGIKAHSDWEIFDDRGIPLGADWHATLQKEVDQCHFGIYLLSQRFLKSEYIRENEFGAFVERQNNSQFPFFGVLLSACNFEPWKEIASRQFFTALGQDYGLASTHRDTQITFDRLARISNGVIDPNPDLEEFFKNFVARANAVLKTIYP